MKLYDSIKVFCIWYKRKDGIDLIKETVNAVRVAEMEAEKQIATAKENAEGEKNQVKTKEADYRTEQMQAAKVKANKAMAEVVKKCNEYDLNQDKKIEEKIVELKALAGEKINMAVEAVIETLV